MCLSESEYDRVHIQAFTVIRSRDKVSVYRVLCLQSTHWVDSQRVRPGENSCNIRVQGEEAISMKNVLPMKNNQTRKKKKKNRIFTDMLTL